MASKGVVRSCLESHVSGEDHTINICDCFVAYSFHFLTIGIEHQPCFRQCHTRMLSLLQVRSSELYDSR